MLSFSMIIIFLLWLLLVFWNIEVLDHLASFCQVEERFHGQSQNQNIDTLVGKGVKLMELVTISTI